jgi:hypothetical protein
MGKIDERRLFRQKITDNFKSKNKMQISNEPENMIIGLVNKNNKILIGRDFSKRKYCSSL